MQEIDALGRRSDRHTTFGRELLAEAEDEELEAIVAEAARDLSMPIALVSMVLEQIQFFKAHYGLPPDLAAARGTNRDVSFCQFVVRDGQPFEVTDAANDDRVPQQLVEDYGIRSYLGMPLRVEGTVVGSLCVLGDEPHTFTDADRERLRHLAELVDRRLAVMNERRAGARSSLLLRAATPALAELRDSIDAIREGAASVRLSVAALASFQRLADHVAGGGSTHPKAMQRALEVAQKALDDCENTLWDLDASGGDAQDSVAALDGLLSPSSSTSLSEVMVSGQELARHNLRPVGGSILPDFDYDPALRTPRPLGVALLAMCLLLIAGQMSSRGSSGEIRLDACDRGEEAEVVIEAEGLDDDALRAVAAEVEKNAGKDPTVRVHVGQNAVRLSFAVA